MWFSTELTDPAFLGLGMSGGANAAGGGKQWTMDGSKAGYFLQEHYKEQIRLQKYNPVAASARKDKYI